RAGPAAEARPADGRQFVGPKGRVLGPELADRLADFRRQRVPRRGRRGWEEAGHAVRLEAGDLPGAGALGRAGLPRPFGRRLTEEDDRADELVGELLGEPGQQAELLPVVGRFVALARRAWHGPSPRIAKRGAMLRSCQGDCKHVWGI